MTSNGILGIDLGTTNSAFAVIEGADPEIVVDGGGDEGYVDAGFEDIDDENDQ